MDYIKSLIDLIYTYESPTADIAIVFGIFVVIYALALLLGLPFIKKKQKVEKEAETPEVITEETVDFEESELEEDEEEVSGFKSAVSVDEPELDEVEIEEATSDLEEKVVVETQSAFKAPVEQETPEQESETEVVQEIEPEIPKIEVEAETAPEPEIEVEEEVVEEPVKEEQSFFSKLRSGLSKTHDGLFGKLGSIFSSGTIDDGVWDEFEEILIMSDIGVPTTMKLRELVASKVSKLSNPDFNSVNNVLREEVHQILKNAETTELNLNNKPSVVMIAGVNGVGKTTSIGKISNLYVNNGNKVMVAAADTFRAAAVEQLEVWANRVGSDFLKGQTGADPSAVAFDAVQASKARNIDILIIDTAGRLHTKSNLMDELKKLKRVVGRELEGAPHETLLVLDATTGQNAVQQAKLFNDAIDVSGIILTKLDGTAKGGVIIAIADELNIPVKYIGVGEGLDDLREFNSEEFIEALFATSDQNIH